MKNKRITCALIRKSSIHKTSAVCFGARIYDCYVGRYCYIGRHTIMCKTKLGSFCSIADHCIISPGKHPTQMVSTSPVFYAKKNCLHRNFHVADFKEYDSVEIGNDVWIGTHALIKGGVKIGNGAIVGAYAVVTKDVDDYTIVAGNPARPIRKRFTEEQISMLLSREWWNYSEEELLEKATYFSDIQKFLENGEVERGLL